MHVPLARALRTVTVSAVAALTVGLVAGNPAHATGTSFPGAGFTVTQVNTMTAIWQVPAVQCTRGENDTVVVGMMGPAVGTLAGWNAASLSGCSAGHPWYRIQTWCNAIGGGFQVAPAAAGDVIVAHLFGAGTSRPLITARNVTHPALAQYHLKQATTSVADGAYAGAQVPHFSNPLLQVTANGRLLSQLQHLRHVQWHGRTLTIGSGQVLNDGMHFWLYFRHA
jgi:hypothetical protein